MIDIIAVRSIGAHKLEIAFSNGTSGVRDFSFVTEKSGPMAAPLKDPAYFARVFVDDGALAWPNGYDWGAQTLHDEMKAEGLLKHADAAE